MLKTITKVNVTQNDIDHLNHVNNSVYVSYFEIGRKEWYYQAGLSQEEKQKRNIGTVIKKLKINFIQESRKGDLLKIVTQPIRLGNSSFLLKQDIYNQSNDHITAAIITSVMFDTINRKSIKVVDEIARHFTKIK